MNRVEEFLDLDPNFKSMSPEEQAKARDWAKSDPEGFAEYVRSSEVYQTAPPEAQAWTDGYFLSAPKPPSKVDEFLADPTPEKQTVLDDLIRPFEMAAAGTRRTMAGYVGVVGDALGDQDLIDTAVEMDSLAEQAQKELTKPVTNPVYRFGLDVVAGLSEQAPGIVGSVMTGGVAPMMGYMGAMVFGKEYQNLRKSNYTPIEAAGYGTILAGIQGGLESIGGNALLAGGPLNARRIIRTALTEGVEEISQEAADTFAKQTVDWAYENQNRLRLEERNGYQIVKDALYAGALGAVSGPIQAAGMRAVDTNAYVELESGVAVPVSSKMSIESRSALKEYLDSSPTPITTEDQLRSAMKVYDDTVGAVRTHLDEIQAAGEQVMGRPMEQDLEGLTVGPDEVSEMAAGANRGIPNRLHRPLNTGDRVAVNPQSGRIQQIKGEGLTTPIDATVLREYKDENENVFVDVVMDGAKEPTVGLPKADLAAPSEAWKFDGMSRINENPALFALFKKIAAVSGGAINESVEVRTALNNALGRLVTRDGVSKVQLAWDMGQDITARVLAHELGHVLQALPSRVVLAHPELRVMKSIADLITDQLSVPVLEQMERDSIRPDSKKIEPKKAEIIARGGEAAYHGALLKAFLGDELGDLARAWNPNFTAGRDDTPKELIATAISAVLNNAPGVKLPAEFQKLLDNWVEQRADLGNLMKQLKSQMDYGRDISNLSEKIQSMFERAARTERDNRAKLSELKRHWEQMMVLGTDQAYALLDPIRKFAGDDAYFKMKDKLDRAARSLGEGGLHYHTFYNEIMDGLVEEGLDQEFREYMFLSKLAFLRVRKAEMLPRPLAEIRADAARVVDKFWPEARTPAERAAKNVEIDKLTEITAEQIKSEITVQLQNPLMIGHKDAAAALDAKKAKLGRSKYEKLEQAKAKFNELRRPLMEKLKEAELIDDTLMEHLMGVDGYVTFTVINNTMNRLGGQVGQPIHAQIGTTSDVMDPLTATLEKDLHIIKWINQETAKRAAYEYLLDIEGLRIKADQFDPRTTYPGLRTSGEAVAREIKPGADGVYPQLGGQWRTLIVRIKSADGKIERKGLAVSEGVAQAFSTDAALYQFMDKLNNLGGPVSLRSTGQFARNVFTVFNPAFWPFNIIRDYKRAIVNLPTQEGRGAGAMAFTWEWMKAFAPAWKMAGGQFTPELRRMVEEGVLPVAGSLQQSPSETQEERLRNVAARHPGVYRDSIRGMNDLWNYAKHQWNRASFFVGRMGRTTELVTKIAAARYFADTTDPAFTRELKNWYIRGAIGSPDFWTHGVVSPVLSNILIFSNPMVQSWKADLEIGFKLDRGTMLKRAAGTIMSRMMTMALLAGFWGEDWKKWMQSINIHDLLNYQIIPLGYTPSGTPAYLRLPSDPAQQVFGGVFTLAMMAAIDPTIKLSEVGSSIVDYTSGQMPGVNPYLPDMLGMIPGTIGHDMWTYAGGGNPYDHFRQAAAISDTAQAARGTDPAHARMEMAMHLARKSGLVTPIFYFAHESEQGIQSEIKDLLNRPVPVVQSVLNRFLKVSDKGRDQRAKRILEQSRSVKAAEVATVRDLGVQIEGGYSNRVEGWFHDLFVGKKVLDEQTIRAVAAHPELVRNIVERIQNNQTTFSNNPRLLAEIRARIRSGRTDEERKILLADLIAQENESNKRR